MNYVITALIAVVTFVGGTFSHTPNLKYDGGADNHIYGSISYPTSLDNFTNPGATDSVATVSHSTQHANENDGIKALETKLGIGASTPMTGTVLIGNGTGSSAFSAAPSVTTVTSSGLGTFGGMLATASSTVVGNFTITGNAIIGGNSTTTNATSTNFFSTTASTTNFYGGGLGSCNTGSQAVTYSSSTGRFGCTTISAGATAVTILPQPNFNTNQTLSSLAANANTTMYVGQIIIPYNITANKISIVPAAVSVAGTLKLALFSEDGQTKTFEVTTASISGTTLQTTALSSVSINAGIYYIAVLAQGTANIDVRSFTTLNVTELLKDVTSEPIVMGTLTVTANTVPSTITPGSITYAAASTAAIRLDN